VAQRISSPKADSSSKARQNAALTGVMSILDVGFALDLLWICDFGLPVKRLQGFWQLHS